MIIKFETAKLAKEKGFDVPCLHRYAIGFRSNNVELQENHSLCHGGGDDLIHRITGDADYCWLNKTNFNLDKYSLASAPTQSELQTWLRDIHQVIVEIKLKTGRDENNPLFYC